MTRSTSLLFLIITLCAVPVFAQLNRTAVSVSGLDTNPCTPIVDGCQNVGILSSFTVRIRDAGTLIRISNTTTTQNITGLHANTPAAIESFGNNWTTGNSRVDVQGTITPVTRN